MKICFKVVTPLQYSLDLEEAIFYILDKAKTNYSENPTKE